MIQASKDSEILVREIPPADTLLVPITHPEHADIFEKYKIRWNAIPALSN
jgi:nitric oxide synthase oxygenase domain/subunit